MEEARWQIIVLSMPERLSPDDSPPTLNYAPPKPPISPNRVFAGVCGVAIGIIAAGLDLLVLRSAQMLIFRPSEREANWIVAEAVLLVVAIVCSIAAWRWLRTAFRGTPITSDDDEPS
jgi:hypothetical protein